MKHLSIFLLCSMIAMQATAQSRTVFFEDFETGTFGNDEWTGWGLQQLTTTDYWIVGACSDKVTPVLTSENNKVAYITKPGGNGANDNAGASPNGRKAHFYRDVHLSVDSIYVLTFDWKSKGTNSLCLQIFGSATSYTPNGNHTTASVTQIGPNFYGYTEWQSASIPFTHTVTEDRRLFFTWVSSSTQANPPAAVDNIRLTAYPKDNAKNISTTTAGDLENQTGIEGATQLTVTGVLDASDFAFIRDKMPVLQTLDISGVTIAEYTGDKGTLLGDHTYPANEIPQNAFYNGSAGKASLATVILPTSAYSVGAAAFRACTGLTGNLDLSKATAIGREAFRECTGLTGTLNLTSAISIGNSAFFFEDFSTPGKFDGVVFSDNLISIGDYAFYYAFHNATGNPTLTIPAKVTSIGDNAFAYSRYFSGNLVIPASVTTIGKAAFQSYGSSAAANKDTLLFASPSQLTVIGESAFSGCSKFTGNLTLPDGVTSIGKSAFSSCSGLNGELKLPSALETIGESAFSSCRNLKFPSPVIIPAGMTKIENSTFSECNNIISITLHDEITTIGNQAFYSSGITAIDLKNVTVIGTNAFQSCKSLISINVPNGVTQIENSTFNGCTALTTVTLPASVTKIGTNTSGAAFKGCTALDSITVLATNPPELNGTSSGFSTNAPFQGVTISGVKLKVPESSVGAYEAASTWTEFNIVGSGYSVSVTSNDNALGVVEGIENRFYSLSENITLTAMPKAGAFINWTSNGVEIGTNEALALNVQSDTAVIANFGNVLVHNLAVAGKLDEVADIATYTRITLSGNINAKDIAYMRDNLPALKELFLSGATIEAYSGEEGTVEGYQTYPANTLPQNAFYNKTTGKALVALTLPNSLTAIGENALRECSRISNALAIPSGVTSIGAYAFYNCSKLTGDLTLPAGLTSIANNTFQGCGGLTGDVVIPAGVTSIGVSAFDNCSSLGTLSLPKNLTSIERFAFRECNGLTSITAHNPVPVFFTGGEGIFGTLNGSTCILYVANSSVGAYKTATLWSAFWNSGENIHGAGFIVSAAPNGAALGSIVGLEDKFYQANDVVSLTATPFGGFFFSNWTSKGAEISQSPTLSLTITQDTAVMANFVKAYSGVVVAGELHSVANIAQTSKLTLEATSTLDARDFAFMRDQMPYLVDLDITAAAIVEYEGPDGTVSGSPLYYAADKVPQESFKGKLLVTAKLPASATLIGESAFRNTTALAEAEIPAAVTIIESYAFDGSGIAHVAFANNAQLTAIGAHAFENAKLTGLNLPTELLTIGDYAFSGCTELAGSLTIPAKVSSIGACAFAKNELSNSSFNKLSEVIFPASLRTIGAHAFRNSKSLESIRIEEGLESIGEYAFGGCSRLKGTLVIPSTMTSVAHDAFASDSIQYLELHAGITALGDWAFANNPFDSVRVYSPTPLALNAQSLNPFSGVNSSSDKRPLLVPEGSYSAYLNAAVWSTFELGSDNLMFEDNIDYGNRDWRVEAAANPPAGGSVGDSSEVRGMPDWIRTANDYDTDEYYYIAGQTAKLKATPAAGYAFVSWTADGSSDVLGTDAVLSYVVTGRAKLIANFTPLYRVTVIANNDEMGTVAGSGDYRADSTASILATPNDSYRFVQWNDGSTDSLRTVTVTQNVTYTAEFAVDMSGIFHVTVSANSNEMGTVSGGGDYRADSTASISATPNAGYRFEQWSDGNTNNPRTVTVTQDMSFTAMFAAIMYTLSVAANDPSMGTVSGGDSYRADSAASISATPNAGYRFERWSDGNTNNPRTVRVTQDTSFTAEFAAIMYTLSVAANDPSMGTVSGSGGYRADSAASISATPNAGYRFERWSDGNTDNPRTVTVTQDASFTAEFAAIMYILSVAANNDEMGTVAGSGDYRADSTASISATPGAGYRFAQWSDGNIDNPRRVRVTQDTSFTAEFAVALLSYQLTAVAVNPSMGTVSGGGTYTEGAVVSINATANAGYRFVRWSDGNTDNPRMVTVTQNITCTAEFASTTTDVEGAEALTISVYPNPAVDYIAVVLPENAARAFFTLYDMQGQVAIEKAIGRREAISVSHLPAGIYIYEVAIEKQRYTGRLVKN